MRRLSFVIVLVGLLTSRSAGALDCPALVRSSDEPATAGYDSGLLWRISARNGAASHVFGTIHISDPRVTALPPAVRDALHDSSRFTMEVVLDEEAMRRISGAMFYEGNESLDRVLNAELFARTADLLTHYGLGIAESRRLKPWAAYTTLSLPPGQTGEPLDLTLMNMAREDDMAVSGLETIDEQISVFGSLTADDINELLTQTVCHYGVFQAEVEEMVRLYLARDLKAIMRMSARYSSTAQDRLLAVLLTGRNRSMVERMRAALDRGGVFVAIGALHLPGSDGVLNLLREAGYEITREY